MTKSMKAAADVTALLKARNTLLWVTSREESRVERYLFEAAAAAGYVTRFWDAGDGLTEVGGKYSNGRPDLPIGLDIGEALAIIKARSRGQSGPDMPTKADRCIWVLRDASAWLTPPIGIVTVRSLRNLARDLQSAPSNNAQAVIVLTASGDVPIDLSNSATAIDWPLPDREEISQALEASVEGPAEKLGRDNVLPKGVRDAAIDAATGLTEEEANACFARSLVNKRSIDPVLIANEKKRVVTRERVLEWLNPLPGGFSAVGGLGNIKDWWTKRGAAFTPEAREYGLPPSKGMLLVGVPGCGKTHIARAGATDWQVPLLKLDMGALKSKFVGESEGNLRRALKVIGALGRVVVLLDEIEKAFGGATSGAADGGVSSDALGTFLSWMQDREGEAFVVATANDISSLPPELLRKGRFDEIWFVDIPTFEERKEVLRAALTAHGRKRVKVDYDKVANVCEGFTGAEIAALVPEALFTAFADGKREVETRDLAEAAGNVVQLTKTAEEKIRKLREWAAGSARSASTNIVQMEPQKQRRGRAVDL